MTNPYLEGEGVPLNEPLETVVPAKARVEVTEGAVAKVVEVKTGEVGFGDKLKNYYKGLIFLIGTVLALVAQVDPLTRFLGDDVQNIVSVVILFLTSLLGFLKANEKWVNTL